MELFSFKIKEIESLLTNKQANNRKNLNLLPLISDKSGNHLKLVFFSHCGFCIFHAFQTLSLFANLFQLRLGQVFKFLKTYYAPSSRSEMFSK